MNSPDINRIENVWNIMQKEIGHQMPCKIGDMWKEVCEAWYSVVLNVLEELYSSMPRRIVDLNIYIPIVIALYETMVRVALHFPMQNIVSWPGVYIR